MRKAITTLLILASPLSQLLLAEIPALIPLPQAVREASGRFELTRETGIAAPAALKNEAELLARRLRKVTQLPLPVSPDAKGIVLALDKSLPAEAYRLEILPGGVRISGGDAAGVFYGTQTFLQSLPPEAHGLLPRPATKWSAPALHVEDAPLTTWRGLHLDSSRHFQPKEFIFKYLDAMAALKLNRFHWHLNDSEAWRLEIRKYPKLTEVHRDFPASYPEEIPTNPTFKARYRYGNFHGGGVYTQADVREIVAYAAARHIVVVPEIGFPGHLMAALTAYPEFSTTGKVPVVASNITPDLIGTHPEAMQFLRDVLDETMDLFPGPWIHFGGDEAPKGQWASDPATQARIDKLGLRIKDSREKHASENALQAWMFSEMTAHIAKKGRKPAGWEEVMHGHNIDKLPKGAIIMPWLSRANAVKSANAGLGVVHTSTGPFYLDSYQVDDNREPSTLYGGPFTIESIYSYELFPKGLTEEGRRNILGAQCQMWAELTPRTDDIEYQVFPRACALAELTWTRPERRANVDAFMQRLERFGDRLTAMHLNHRRITPAPSLRWSPGALVSGKPWVVTLPADAAQRLRGGKPLKVLFQYQGGGNGLDIESAELLVKGKAVAVDKHKGFTGGSPRNAEYTLTLPAGTEAGDIQLRVSAKGSGGTDSNGTILLR